ncbi:DUF6221 family protein [Streptomyces sp. NPDC052496]|uniref:DUF6221 family protein n=1 Tax=Streptomyces sp. NPDC052496 TaxID=3154951 RepID=UPI00343BC6ED
MHRTIGSPEVTSTFERCERLCRSARQVTDRALRMQSEAAEARLRAAQMRYDLRRTLSAHRSAVAAERPFPATAGRRNILTPPSRPAARTTQLTLLAAFVHARLDEEAATAELFHEAGCPGGTGTMCRCPVPEQVRREIAIRHATARDSEEAILEADHDARDWPHSEVIALLRLKVLALPYELHRHWREEWRP